MPISFLNAGIWFGLFATFFVGFIYTYSVQILVKSSRTLCQRNKIPSLTYADIAETAFSTGPSRLRKWSYTARVIVNVLLVIDLLGCCCVYNVFVTTNVHQMIDYYFDFDIKLETMYLLLLIPLIPINLTRNLKRLVPFSMVANILIVFDAVIILYYSCFDLPPLTVRPAIAALHRWPIFFGMMIFGLEGIGVIMSLENK